MFCVYILQNLNGRFYIGQTDNLEARIKNHNSPEKTLGKCTRKNGPWDLVWFEEHSTRSSALKREREIKSWKSAKRIRSELLNNSAVESRLRD